MPSIICATAEVGVIMVSSLQMLLTECSVLRDETHFVFLCKSPTNCTSRATVVYTAHTCRSTQLHTYKPHAVRSLPGVTAVAEIIPAKFRRDCYDTISTTSSGVKRTPSSNRLTYIASYHMFSNNVVCLSSLHAYKRIYATHTQRTAFCFKSGQTATRETPAASPPFTRQPIVGPTHPK